VGLSTRRHGTVKFTANGWVRPSMVEAAGMQQGDAAVRRRKAPARAGAVHSCCCARCCPAGQQRVSPRSAPTRAPHQPPACRSARAARGMDAGGCRGGAGLALGPPHGGGQPPCVSNTHAVAAMSKGGRARAAAALTELAEGQRYAVPDCPPFGPSTTHPCPPPPPGVHQRRVCRPLRYG
jgi:hypothetical protein